MIIRSRPRQQPRPPRRGGAMIETVLVFPILVMVVFAVVELGYFVFVRHTLTGAARAGSRAGIVAGINDSAVAETAVVNAMDAAGFSRASYSINVTPNLAAARPGDDVKVLIECNWDIVGVRPWGFIPKGAMVRGVAVMRKE